MPARPTVVAGVPPVPGTTLFLERPEGLLVRVTICTWDDICPQWMRCIGERQRRGVHELQRQGYSIGAIVPIFNYPDLDHLSICMVRLLPGDRVREVSVRPDGHACVRYEDARIMPPPVPDYPPAPADYPLCADDTGFLARFAGHPDALACVRFAAAVNGGPPSWITRHLHPDAVAEVEGSYTSEGSERVAIILEQQCEWKLYPPPGFRVCAELGFFRDECQPGVALLVLERRARGWKQPVRRNLWRFRTGKGGAICLVEVVHNRQELGVLTLTGIRPGLKNRRPRERSQP